MGIFIRKKYCIRDIYNHTTTTPTTLPIMPNYVPPGYTPEQLAAALAAAAQNLQNQQNQQNPPPSIPPNILYLNGVQVNKTTKAADFSDYSVSASFVPASDAHLTNKKYVDDRFSVLMGDVPMSTLDTITKIDNYIAGAGDSQNIVGQLATLKSDITSLSAGSSGATDAEVTRAKAAEAAISSNLGDEVSRATNAEGVIASSLTLVNTNLDSEVSRAQAAESALSASIQSLSDNHATLSGAHAITISNLGDEVARATGAEATLHAEVYAESTIARTAEATLSQRVDTEESRAKTKEADLLTAINDNYALLNTSVSNEVTRATGAEATMNARVNALYTYFFQQLTIPASV